MTDGPDPEPAASSYYVPLPDGRFQPTIHVQGAWNDHEQHMGPVSGLIAHAIDRHEPRPEMLLARICYEILGVIPAEPTSVTVETIRPGRTIELVEATLVAGARPAIRARAWRIARGDTRAVAGGLPEPLPPPDDFAPWNGRSVWSGGYIASLDMRGHPQNTPGPRPRLDPPQRPAGRGSRREPDRRIPGPRRHRERHCGTGGSAVVDVPQRRPDRASPARAGGGVGRVRHHRGLRQRRAGGDQLDALRRRWARSGGRSSR